MQNTDIKKIVQILLFLLPLSAVSADNERDMLYKGDSLFALGGYTQALGIYEELYKTHRVFSPAMLVKMAYVYEGLGDATMSLYMLNKYYLRNPDHEVLQKMASLAQKNNLPGYEYKEKNFLITYYKQYEEEILRVVLIVLMAMFMLGLINRIRGNYPTPGFLLFYFILAASAFLVHFRGIDERYGIVVREDTRAYEQPASASAVKMNLPRGSRMIISDQQDKWFQVVLEEGQQVWVNMYCVQPVY